METKTLDEIREFRYNKLQELLDKLPEGWRNKFKRMYGTNKASEIPDDKIDWAIKQCENSLRKLNKPV